MDVNAILQAVAKLAEYDKDGTPIIVHCMGGNNRSRTVVEAFYFAKLGTHLEDEYKGYPNHLLFNCGEGFLPPNKGLVTNPSAYPYETWINDLLRYGKDDKAYSRELGAVECCLIIYIHRKSGKSRR